MTSKPTPVPREVASSSHALQVWPAAPQGKTLPQPKTLTPLTLSSPVYRAQDYSTLGRNLLAPPPNQWRARARQQLVREVELGQGGDQENPPTHWGQQKESTGNELTSTKHNLSRKAEHQRTQKRPLNALK